MAILAAQIYRCNAPKFVIARRPQADAAISGRHSQPVQAAVKMEKAEIWGVAALSDRLAG